MTAVTGSRPAMILAGLVLVVVAGLTLTGFLGVETFDASGPHPSPQPMNSDGAKEVEADAVAEAVRGLGRVGIEVGDRAEADLIAGSAPETLAATEPEPAGPVLAAKALFVDGSRPDGPHLGTIDAPFHRPIDALTVVEPGTTIYFRGGTYDTEVHGFNILRRSGTPDAWIHITPFPGEAVEIVSGGEWGNGFEFQGVAYATLSGFTFTGRDNSIHGSGVFGKLGNRDIIVSDNYIEGFGGAGVSFVQSSRITVERNEVRNNAARSFYQGSGISLFEATGPLRDNGGFTNVIRANLVVGNYNGVVSRDGRLTDGNCIIIDFFNEVNYQGSTLVENNVCVENGGRGVHVFYSNNVTARNNTLIGNGWSPDLFGGRGEMVAARGSNISFYNNLVLNREGVAAYVESGADGLFINNLVASGPPEGDGNRVLPAEAPLLVAPSAAATLDQFRPVAGGELTGAARSDLQSPVDALGGLRPPQGSVGALEPLLTTTIGADHAGAD